MRELYLRKNICGTLFFDSLKSLFYKGKNGGGEGSRTLSSLLPYDSRRTQSLLIKGIIYLGERRESPAFPNSAEHLRNI